MCYFEFHPKDFELQVVASGKALEEIITERALGYMQESFGAGNLKEIKMDPLPQDAERMYFKGLFYFNGPSFSDEQMEFLKRMRLQLPFELVPDQEADITVA